MGRAACGGADTLLSWPVSTGRPAKEPGRIKQLIDVFHMTRKADSTLIWWMLLAFVVPLLVGLILPLCPAARSSA